MFVQFIVKGENAFGATLKKDGVLYLFYNFENDEFDIQYLKIDEDIFVDNRKK